MKLASMLREQPHQRPNIYQIVREVHYLRGREVPINDVSKLIGANGLRLINY